MEDEDLEFARLLQSQFDQEASSEMAPYLPPCYRTPQKQTKLSVVSDEWETIDPTPDLHALFIEFNQTFFWGKLLSCEVRWSPRMTQCAGICRYSPRERFCTIGISIPLLKLRPRKDLVETLLHEMIHAFLFVTDNNDDHDGHGPEFHKHMYRINQATGANISVYHTFHDEVALYKQHWWRCTGSCTKRPPFYGFVKRSMNRAPGPSDRWWAQHQTSCGGAFNKVKEPEGFGEKKSKASSKDLKSKGQRDIRTLFGSTTSKPDKSNNNVNMPVGSGVGKKGSPVKSGAKIPPNKSGGKRPPTKPGSNVPPNEGGGRGNIFGFGGTSFSSPGGSGGGLKTAGKTGTIVEKPGWKTKDNSSGGSVIKPINPNTLPDPGPRIGTGASGSWVGSSSSESGKLLGGAEPPTLSAREMARLKWASSQPANSSVINSCAKSDKVMEKSGSLSEQGPSSKPGLNLAGCPVCGVQVPADRINPHLDLCLRNQEAGPAPESKPVPDTDTDVFNDSDDDLLLSAAVEAERSVISIPDTEDDRPDSEDDRPDSEDDRPLLSIEDSDEDDEEPILKKWKADRTLDQDDNDILASLEGVDDVSSGEFACPVCQKLVANSDMNIHLDQCLSRQS